MFFELRFKFVFKWFWDCVGLFFPVRASAQGSLCVPSLWLYTVGMSVEGWRINCDVKHVLFEKGLFQVTVCRPLVLLEKNA